MEISRLIIISILFLYSVNNSAFCQPKDTTLTIKATLIGSYSNPLDDSCYYFLVEIKLINSTDSLCEFVNYSCTALMNIIWDTKRITLFYPNCASNYPTTIKVKPNQEYSIPIFFQAKRTSEVIDNQIKFGFILLHPRYFGNDYIPGIFKKMRTSNENVLWSNSITLHSTSFEPYKVGNIGN